MVDRRHIRKIAVGMAGFEPAASCSQSRRANQAALHPGAALALAGSAGGTAQVYGKVALTLVAAGGRGRTGGCDGRRPRSNPLQEGLGAESVGKSAMW
jgi:hypothetical protein